MHYTLIDGLESIDVLLVVIAHTATLIKSILCQNQLHLRL